MNTLLEAEDVRQIIANEYVLPTVMQVELERRGFNDTYWLGTGDGRLYFRIYFNGKYYIEGPGDFQFELDLLCHLQRRGASVSVPLPRSDGSPLGAVETTQGVRHFALFTDAPGERLREPEPGQAFRIGSMLGQVHRAADSFRSKHHRYHLDETYLFEEPLKLIDAALRSGSLPGLDAHASAISSIRQRLKALPRDAGRYGIIHGDPHSGNFNCLPGGDPTFFDFDHGGHGWRAYDLGVCAAGMPAASRQACIEGYESIRPLLEGERDSIDLLQRVRPLWDCGDILAMGRAWGDDWEPGDKFMQQLPVMIEQLFTA